MKSTATFLYVLPFLVWLCCAWGSAPGYPSGLPDPDNDGLTNEQEAALGTDPNNPDSDGDRIRDGLDPDIIAGVIGALPVQVFKSGGLRTAALNRLADVEHATAQGHFDVAAHELENLRRLMDGCPPKADNNDWIIHCAAQIKVRNVLDILLANYPSYAIDANIVPSLPSLPGLAGGPPRLVGVVVGSSGKPEEFVIDEVVFQPKNADDLNEFLGKYSGTVLRDGRPHLLPGAALPPGLAETTGWYLIRVDLNRSSLHDMAVNVERSGLMGRLSFSSEEAARLISLVAREYDRGVSPNFLGDVAQTCKVCEHPVSATQYLDGANWWWMTEDDDPSRPGDQGLSVGVIHAWEYVKYKGYPPDAPYSPVILAVIDSGFDLDEGTGAPLNGNLDYQGVPLQIDEIDGDLTAGGQGTGFPNCNSSTPPPGCWHGQMSFGVSAALSRNYFGTAGTSGGWEVKPLLIKVNADLSTWATGIYDALYNSADVINMSLAQECGYICRTYQGGNSLKAALKTALYNNSIVVASAGNQGQDISDVDKYPCTINGVVCVGAVDRNGWAGTYSNYGTTVDIWAPAGVFSTVTRNSAAADVATENDNLGEDELHVFGGTSCSAPFLSGIVALMKMLNPSITYDQVRGTLRNTANASFDPKVHTGYVDAYQAVAAVKPNNPPVVTITEPTQTTTGYQNVFFSAHVKDPESPSPSPHWGYGDFSSRLVFSSDIQGTLCTATGDATGAGTTLICTASQLSLGPHVITATATDPFGAQGNDTLNIWVANTPPTAKITFPATGSTYFTSQKVNVRGYGFDPDEAIQDAMLSWTSNVSGSLGTGSDLWVSLPQGSHTITLTAKDSLGQIGKDSIVVTVKVGEGYPTAQIVNPPHNTVVAVGQIVHLEGKGFDPEDGLLPGPSLRWSSDRDGYLGTGSSLQTKLSGGACDTSVPHTITLEVKDSNGNTATHSIVVVVMNLC